MALVFFLLFYFIYLFNYITVFLAGTLSSELLYQVLYKDHLPSWVIRMLTDLPIKAVGECTLDSLRIKDINLFCVEQNLQLQPINKPSGVKYITQYLDQKICNKRNCHS